MALIKCSKCGQEISDQAQKCIHCGAKLNQKEKKEKRRKVKKIIFSFLAFIILIIIGILSTLIIVNLFMYNGLYNKDYCTNIVTTDFFIMSVILALLVLGELVIIFSTKINKILKILSTLSIMVGIVTIILFITNYTTAQKYDCDISIKTLVKEGNYELENAKKLHEQIDDVIYPYSEYSIPITHIYQNENKVQTFYFNEEALNEGTNFALELKITNNKIENMYWSFNEDTDIYLYQNYQKAEKAKYYAKVIQYTSGDEDCISCNYLKDQLISAIHDKTNITIDKTKFNTLYYDEAKDLFYYGIKVDNKLINAYLLDKDNHELNYRIKLNSN